MSSLDFNYFVFCYDSYYCRHSEHLTCFFPLSGFIIANGCDPIDVK